MTGASVYDLIASHRLLHSWKGFKKTKGPQGCNLMQDKNLIPVPPQQVFVYYIPGGTTIKDFSLVIVA